MMLLAWLKLPSNNKQFFLVDDNKLMATSSWELFVLSIFNDSFIYFLATRTEY